MAHHFFVSQPSCQPEPFASFLLLSLLAGPPCQLPVTLSSSTQILPLWPFRSQATHVKIFALTSFPESLKCVIVGLTFVSPIRAWEAITTEVFHHQNSLLSKVLHPSHLCRWICAAAFYILLLSPSLEHQRLVVTLISPNPTAPPPPDLVAGKSLHHPMCVMPCSELSLSDLHLPLVLPVIEPNRAVTVAVLHRPRSLSRCHLRRPLVSSSFPW